MLALKFDVDPSSIAFDRPQGRLAMTLHPVIPTYDEAAAIVYGWAVMSGCRDIRRLVVEIDVEAGPLPRASSGVRHAA
ncbi:hypothetical protein EV667_2872 [Ancylobacter aquaticus]|uniref:Uncharacterized protein n=1 Tax=Ancylobacter aquaticus TaxID=100 RepID=A0A4R1I261_ANCAQ|nr:hypothetical protein [Ancylobacter aquaticus]TCK28858.1 hypothetical protein EV667_2872 [Ancylobacter aquaticus]